MARTYYGFTHPYGANMVDHNGHPIGYVACFPDRVSRDAWVDGGDDDITAADYRDAVTQIVEIVGSPAECDSTASDYREAVTLRWLQAHGFGWVNRPGSHRFRDDNGVTFAA